MENDSTFVAPEGVYSVTDEHKPNHAQNVAMSVGTAIYPSRVSSIVLRFPPPKQGNVPGFAGLLGGGKSEPKKDKGEKAAKDREDGISLSSSDTPEESEPPPLSSSDQGNTSQSPEYRNLFSHPSAGGKKKTAARPKHNIRTTSSTFITRIQTAEGLTKTLQSKQGDVTFLFYNMAKSFVWIEAGSKAKEPLSRITFSAHPTCHDINISTANPDRLDVIIGFNTGDLIWLDPINSRYGRLNKQGSISGSPCTAVRWVPSSSTLFLVSHADGTIIVYDKERDDGTFTPQDPNSGTNDASSNFVSSPVDGITQEWDPVDSLFVTMPPWHPVTSGGGALSAVGKAEKEKVAKNPVSHWRLSKQGVVDFVFSPDVKYVAAISEDGCLRVIDALAEQLVDCYASYFGALTCVAWSPDGRFILTGGQDDLLTIFSPWEQRVVARCQGHSSFVSSVAFDEQRCDGRTYRFGSVAEDNKLIFWDFSSGALHRPKFQASHHQRMSVSSTISLAYKRDRSAQYLPATNSPKLEETPSPRFHPAPSRNEIAFVQPVLIKQLDCDLLTVIQFLPRSILTATKGGQIRLWVRPLALRPRFMKNNKVTAIDPHDLIPSRTGPIPP
ncbi:putative catabolite repression protein creC [Psilocybe cubensis]|uniref:Catabolite repression protein creC n=2 Tax=Psilocybe cubensis TaxID=181762 RepID=A0ACB8H8K3_PSICU|nr:putative catabolite repression protein creC [Psilocybe cubensis]KAH9484123.1 putative catabolite repression protein creC [Psilocybe cubensis]